MLIRFKTWSGSLAVPQSMGRRSSEIRQPFKATSGPQLPPVVFWEAFVMLLTHFRVDLQAAAHPWAKQPTHTAPREIPAASNFFYYSPLNLHVEIMLQYSQSKEKKNLYIYISKWEAVFNKLLELSMYLRNVSFGIFKVDVRSRLASPTNSWCGFQLKAFGWCRRLYAGKGDDVV